MLNTTLAAHRPQRAARVTAALLLMTHFVLAAAIALSALFGSYAGGDWTWWMSQAHVHKTR